MVLFMALGLHEEPFQRVSAIDEVFSRESSDMSKYAVPHKLEVQLYCLDCH